MRYISAVDESCGNAVATPATGCPTGDGTHELDATTYHDVQVGWSNAFGARGSKLALGVNNLFDEDPPLVRELLAQRLRRRHLRPAVPLLVRGRAVQVLIVAGVANDGRRCQSPPVFFCAERIGTISAQASADPGHVELQGKREVVGTRGGLRAHSPQPRSRLTRMWSIARCGASGERRHHAAGGRNWVRWYSSDISGRSARQLKSPISTAWRWPAQHFADEGQLRMPRRGAERKMRDGDHEAVVAGAEARQQQAAALDPAGQRMVEHFHRLEPAEQAVRAGGDAADAAIGLVAPEIEAAAFGEVVRLVGETRTPAAGIAFLQSDDVVAAGEARRCRRARCACRPPAARATSCGSRSRCSGGCSSRPGCWR